MSSNPNHSAYWADEEDPLAQEHGLAKLQRADMRLTAAMVQILKLQGNKDEAEVIERNMAEGHELDIYGGKAWRDAQEYVRLQSETLVATVHKRLATENARLRRRIAELEAKVRP